MNIKKQNMKLYPIYRMIGADYLFYYGLEILFFTYIKGLSVANVVLGGSVCAIANIIAQFPATMICDKLGIKKTITIEL